MTVPLPTQLVRSWTRRLVTAVDGTISPFTGEEQVQDWGGEWWEYDIEFSIIDGRSAAVLSVFFDALGGRRGTFLFKDPSYQVATPGTPRVNGAGQTGNTLVTDGWVASTTPLLAGDAFHLGSAATTRLYRLTADVVANGSGQATISFVPRLRSSPADNALLEVDAPAVLLRPSEPVPSVIDTAGHYRFSLKAREAL